MNNKTKDPRIGTTRYIHRFLWLPLTINDETRWLRWELYQQMFVMYPVTIHCGHGRVREYRRGWVNKRWAEWFECHSPYTREEAEADAEKMLPRRTRK